MTKKDRCKQIALAHPEATRPELINMFVDQVGCTAAAASTYASTVRKEILEEAPARLAAEARADESDEEIRQRLDERFETIDMLSHASTQGRIRSLIISGPGGLGKSYTVEQAIREYDPERNRSIIAKGFVKPTGLYLLLHRYRHPGNVIVLDDCDSIFRDEDAMNILKAALDTTRERIIRWGAETRMADEDGEPIDREFEFKGTVIFLTNVDLDAEIAKGGRLASHYEAFVSRSHYVECDMHSSRDYVVRIQQLCERGMLVDQKGLSQAQSARVVKYIEQHQGALRELTLRMALKLADLLLMDETRFEQMAKVSCHKRRV